MPAGSSSKMATKNCPKCENANPVACKKCACGHVFFTSRRSAHAIAAEVTDEEQAIPQEPEVPRRRTARVTRERPQFYDALQVENQSRRQRELQKRRKASKSEDTETVVEEPPPEKPVSVPGPSRKRAETPPPKVEPPVKKRRGRPPGLSSRKSTRSQILTSKSGDNAKIAGDGVSGANLVPENVEGIHDIPPVKALQMNMVLADINSRIERSGVRADEIDAKSVKSDFGAKKKGKPEVKSETDASSKKKIQSAKAETNGTSTDEKMEVDEVPEKESGVGKKDVGKPETIEEPAKMEIDEPLKVDDTIKGEKKEPEKMVVAKKLLADKESEKIDPSIRKPGNPPLTKSEDEKKAVVKVASEVKRVEASAKSDEKPADKSADAGGAERKVVKKVPRDQHEEKDNCQVKAVKEETLALKVDKKEESKDRLEENGNSQIKAVERDTGSSKDEKADGKGESKTGESYIPKIKLADPKEKDGVKSDGNSSTEKEIDVVNKKEVDVSKEKEVDGAKEKEIDGAKEKEVDAAKGKVRSDSENVTKEVTCSGKPESGSSECVKA
ncbi:unnamed protein product [Orchesella dallaii]|uniref:Uncharacterized protein n=1 Tax=Orchesella dallaii TaxID=48710 RepID=A0ABP1PZE0_9HEXA